MKVSPFCDNMAGIIVSDVGLRKKLLDFGCGSLLSCAIHTKLWNNSTVAKMWASFFPGGWLKVEDLPPHLWSKDIVKSLALLCWGWTVMRSRLFKKKNHEVVILGGWRLCELQLSEKEGSERKWGHRLTKKKSHCSVNIKNKKQLY